MTARLCAICQRPEVFLVHEARRISNLNESGHCVRCVFAPEIGMERRLQQSIELNEKLKGIQEKAR